MDNENKCPYSSRCKEDKTDAICNNIDCVFCDNYWVFYDEDYLNKKERADSNE